MKPCGKNTGKRLKSLGGEKPGVNLVRYADDFVIASKSKELLEGEIKPLVEHFLQERGLELSPKKTAITHVKHGFDFLGQTCADILTGNCSSSLPRRMLKPFWMASDEPSKLHMACLPPT